MEYLIKKTCGRLGKHSTLMHMKFIKIVKAVYSLCALQTTCGLTKMHNGLLYRHHTAQCFTYFQKPPNSNTFYAPRKVACILLPAFGFQAYYEMQAVSHLVYLFGMYIWEHKHDKHK